MAQYLKNDKNYHGARSKTSVTGSQKNCGSGDGWGTLKTSCMTTDNDGLWNDVPDNVAENGWEQEREVKGKSKRNRRFRPLTSNDLIPNSNHSVPNWNNMDSEFPVLEPSKPPAINVWKKREEKFQELQALQPTDMSEEELMIQKALEMSKIEAMKEEEKRRELEEEYKLQMHLLEANPLLFEDFRTDEELAITISETELISEEADDLPLLDDECSNSQAFQKEQDYLGTKTLPKSKKCFQRSNSSKQNELKTDPKEYNALLSVDKNINDLSNILQNTTSHAGTISRVSKTVDMFGGWGTSKKYSQESKTLDEQSTDIKAPKSNLRNDANTASNKDVKAHSNSTEAPVKSRTNFKKNEATITENFRSSDIVSKDKNSCKSFEKDVKVCDKSKISKNQTKDVPILDQIYCEDLISKAKIKDNNFTDKHGYIDIEAHLTGNNNEFSKENGFTLKTEDILSHEQTKNHFKTENKERLPSASKIERVKSKTNSETFLNAVVSDYSEIAAACGNESTKDSNQEKNKTSEHEIGKLKPVSESIFNILEKDYSSTDAWSESVTNTFGTVGINTSPSKNVPFKVNCDTQFSIPEPSFADNEIPYSLKSNQNVSNENICIPNHTSNLHTGRTSASSSSIDLANSDKICDSDISLPLFNTLSNNGNDSDLVGGNASSTSIDPPIPSPIATSFPEPLTAHFPSYSDPVPPTYVNPNFMMNPNLMMNPVIMHQMLIAYPFLLRQLQEMDFYYRSSGLAIGSSSPLYSQPSSMLGGIQSSADQPFMNPICNLPATGQTNILNPTSEMNLSSPLIDPPVPPPHPRTEFENTSSSPELLKMNSNFVLPEIRPDITQSSRTDNSWLDNFLSKDPTFSNVSSIPPPIQPQNNVPDNSGLGVSSIEEMQKSALSSSNAVSNCDKSYTLNLMDDMTSDDFTLPKTNPLGCNNTTFSCPQAGYTSHDTNGLKFNNTAKSNNLEVSSWNTEVKGRESKCPSVNLMRNSSRFASEKNSEHRQPSSQPYLGRRKK